MDRYLVWVNMLFIKWFVILYMFCYAVYVLLGDTKFDIDEWVKEKIQKIWKMVVMIEIKKQEERELRSRKEKIKENEKVYEGKNSVSIIILTYNMFWYIVVSSII